jgi:hypothetical protein
MNSIGHRVADLVRESETLHQSFKDHSLIFEAGSLQRHHRRRRGLYRRACSSHQCRARISEKARLVRLVNHGKSTLPFLTRQYPTLEFAESTHWYKVYYKVQVMIRLYRSVISDKADILNGLSAILL